MTGATTTPKASFPLSDAGYLLPYALTAGLFIANHLSGVLPIGGLIIGFIGVPLVDWAVGVQTHNPAPDEEAALEAKWIYRILLYTWAPVQVALTTYGMYRFSTAVDVPLWARGVIILSAGIPSGAIGITIAHELGHRSGLLDKTVARILLGIVCYMHFTVEHNRGHHIRVATPNDPATARFGESFWFFYVRTVPQQWLSAWRLENERVRKGGGRALSTRNRMIWFTVIPIVLGVLAYLWLGWLAVLFFYGQAIVAFGLLESVNYLEHYGLLRRELEPGVYERVTPNHSWNASYPLSNWLLFRLQRHADHHAFAARRFQVLRHLPEGPQLPLGYPTMIPLSLVPPLWFWVMNKRAIAVRKASGTWTEQDEQRFGPTDHIAPAMAGVTAS